MGSMFVPNFMKIERGVRINYLVSSVRLIYQNLELYIKCYPTKATPTKISVSRPLPVSVTVNFKSSIIPLLSCIFYRKAVSSCVSVLSKVAQINVCVLVAMQKMKVQVNNGLKS